MTGPASLLADINARIAQAAKLARRAPSEVTLVAVSKTHPAERITPLIEATRHIGTIRITASGSSQDSYSAASTRNTKATPSPKAIAAVWSMRKKSVGLLGNMQGERRPMPFVEDTVVPPQHLADYALAVKTGLQFPKPPCRVQHPSPQ